MRALHNFFFCFILLFLACDSGYSARDNYTPSVFNFSVEKPEAYPNDCYSCYPEYKMKLYINSYVKKLKGLDLFFYFFTKKRTTEKTRTLIQWSQYDTDTIDANFIDGVENMSHYFLINKIWYNGVEHKHWSHFRQFSCLKTDTTIMRNPIITQDPRRPDSLAMCGRFLVRYFEHDTVATELKETSEVEVIRDGFFIEYYQDDSTVQNIKDWSASQIKRVKENMENPDSLAIVNDSILVWHYTRRDSVLAVVKCGGVCY